MQYYNYADEIIKDVDSQLTESRYIRYYTLPGDDDIVNEQQQATSVNAGEDDTITTGNNNADEKALAFKEGIKDDDVNIEEDLDEELNTGSAG